MKSNVGAPLPQVRHAYVFITYWSVVVDAGIRLVCYKELSGTDVSTTDIQRPLTNTSGIAKNILQAIRRVQTICFVTIRCLII
jgi:hypothetical protein